MQQNCLICGLPLEEGCTVCPRCGCDQNAEAERRAQNPGPNAAGQNMLPYPPAMQSAPMYPEELRPLGAGEFFLYRLLFALPLIGWIFALIWSFDGNNLNRRNLARSMWISWGIKLAVAAAGVLVLAALLHFCGGMIEYLLQEFDPSLYGYGGFYY